jgi:hypothetical protein
MKKGLTLSVIFIMVLTLFSFNAPASLADEKKISITFAIEVLSKYVGCAAEIIHDDFVKQSSITILSPTGIYFNAWFSFDLQDGNLSSSYGDEIDWTAGWLGAVKGFGVDIGVSYFDIVELFDSNGDIIQPYIEIERVFRVAENHSLSPYVRFEWLIPIDVKTHETGEYIYGGVRHNWVISELATMNQRAALLYYDVQNSKECGLAGQYDFALAWNAFSLVEWNQLKYVTINLPIMKARIPLLLQKEQDDRKTEAVVGAGLTISF